MMECPWPTATIADCLDPVSFSSTVKIQTRDYQQTGRFPIIDQGQEPIAGWTNDEDAVISYPLPLIVFGDYSRAFKFIDFPFARGADRNRRRPATHRACASTTIIARCRRPGFETRRDARVVHAGTARRAAERDRDRACAGELGGCELLSSARMAPIRHIHAMQ